MFIPRPEARWIWYSCVNPNHNFNREVATWGREQIYPYILHIPSYSPDYLHYIYSYILTIIMDHFYSYSHETIGKEACSPFPRINHQKGPKELAPIFEDIKKNGIEAAMKYYQDEALPWLRLGWTFFHRHYWGDMILSHSQFGNFSNGWKKNPMLEWKMMERELSA